MVLTSTPWSYQQNITLAWVLRYMMRIHDLIFIFTQVCWIENSQVAPPLVHFMPLLLPLFLCHISHTSVCSASYLFPIYLPALPHASCREEAASLSCSWKDEREGRERRQKLWGVGGGERRWSGQMYLWGFDLTDMVCVWAPRDTHVWLITHAIWEICYGC